MKQYQKMKNSGIEWIGEIPEHWKIMRLKYLADVQTGTKDTIDREDDGQYPLFVRSEKIEKISTYSYDGEAILTPGEGDIGKIFHYINGKFDFHQRVYKISDFKYIIGKFLYYYLLENLKNEVVKLSAKTTVDSLRLPMFLNFLVVFGSEKEQEHIVDFLDNETTKLDSEIQNNQKLIELLKEKRKALINQAVTKGLDPTVLMKDSGIEWIGKIPEHWNFLPIGKVCKSLVPGRCKPEKFDGDIPWITTPDIDSDFINKSKKELGLSIEEIKRIGTKIIPKNSVIMTCVGDIGITAISETQIVINQQLHAFQPTEYIVPYYLAKTIRMQSDVLTETANTTVVRYLNKQNCESILIPIPPVEEQKKISEFIKNENDKIKLLFSKIESHIQKLQEYRQALISAAVTGKIDVRKAVIAQ